MPICLKSTKLPDTTTGPKTVKVKRDGVKYERVNTRHDLLRVKDDSTNRTIVLLDSHYFANFHIDTYKSFLTR